MKEYLIGGGLIISIITAFIFCYFVDFTPLLGDVSFTIQVIRLTLTIYALFAISTSLPGMAGISLILGLHTIIIFIGLLDFIFGMSGGTSDLYKFWDSLFTFTVSGYIEAFDVHMINIGMPLIEPFMLALVLTGPFFLAGLTIPIGLELGFDKMWPLVILTLGALVGCLINMFVMIKVWPVEDFLNDYVNHFTLVFTQFFICGLGIYFSILIIFWLISGFVSFTED